MANIVKWKRICQASLALWLRRPWPYFEKVQQSNAVNTTAYMLPLYLPWLSLNFHTSWVHRSSVHMGYYKHCAGELARNPGRHAYCAYFLCSFTCSLDPLTSHIKYKLKELLRALNQVWSSSDHEAQVNF